MMGTIIIYAVSTVYVLTTKEDKNKTRFENFIKDKIVRATKNDIFVLNIVMSPIFLLLKGIKHMKEYWKSNGDEVKQVSKEKFKEVVASLKKSN